MKKVLADACVVAGGLMVGTNIRQLNTVTGCVFVFFGVILVVAGLIMAR